jgi:hypothetical protein
MCAMTQVLNQSTKQLWHQLDLAHDGVAASAEQPAHAAGRMAVINDQVAFGGAAQQAPTVLRRSHRLNLFWRELVLPHQSGSQILRFGQLRILASPLTKSFVTSCLIGLAILPISAAGADTALWSFPAPLAEFGFIQAEPASLACQQHPSIVAWSRDITTDIDQPCHADVLIELANA